MENLIKQLGETLQKASDHLDYCGYGDSWERECSQTLEKDINKVLENYNKYIKDSGENN